MDDVKTTSSPSQEQVTFRDRLTTVDTEGRRIWLYPKEPKNGTLWKWRKRLSYLQLLVLFGLPFLTVKGHQAVLLNIFERKFIFFGHVFWPEDMYLFALFFITLVVFILFFTATVGRIFCGWLCPQTVFLELVFRRIERAIEGDGPKQRKLDQSPWTWEKVWKKATKHAIFLALSFLIGNLFLAYIIGRETLFEWVTQPPTAHLSGFLAVVFFSLLFYGIFSRFREQACIAICPYGRLQSVLQDENTIMVTYDYKRGEPRGKGGKNRRAGLGDCVDCRQCIAVCPTGIDIRNGIQMECVNCTACIDACNAVMDKVGKPRGLIRYSSQVMVETGQPFRPTVRMIAYGVLFVLLLSFSVYLFATAPNARAIITHAHGSLYFDLSETELANAYQYQLLNKTFDERTFTFKLLSPKEGRVKLGQPQIRLKGEEIQKGTLLVILPKRILKSGRMEIQVGLFEGDKLEDVISLSFITPSSHR